MATKTALSVILPVRNGARYLRRALDSLHAQSFRDFEVLVIDDGSGDGSPAVVADYARRDRRVRLLSNPGTGLVDALNFGLVSAAAEVVARMDHDDRARPARFAAQVEFLERHPEVLAVGAQIQPFTTNGRRLAASWYPCAPDDVRRTMQRTNCVAHPTAMMRRDAILALGGYRRWFRRAEDYDLWLRVLDRGEIANLDQVCLDYRLHGGMSSLRHAEHRVLESTVARFLAERRHQGLPEPAIDENTEPRHMLARFGVNERDLMRLRRKAWLGAARTAHRIGDREARSACLEKAGGWRSADGGPRDLADFVWRRLKVYL